MIFLVFIMWGACCHLTLPTVWTLRRLWHISLWFFSTNPNLPTPRTLIFLCKYTWWLVSLSAPLKGKRVQNFIGIWELSHGQKLVTWKWAISRKNLCLTCNHSRGVRRIRAQERQKDKGLLRFSFTFCLYFRSFLVGGGRGGRKKKCAVQGGGRKTTSVKLRSRTTKFKKLCDAVQWFTRIFVSFSGRDLEII